MLERPLYLIGLEKKIIIGINIRGGFVFLDKYIKRILFISLSKWNKLWL